MHVGPLRAIRARAVCLLVPCWPKRGLFIAAVAVIINSAVEFVSSRVAIHRADQGVAVSRDQLLRVLEGGSSRH